MRIPFVGPIAVLGMLQMAFWLACFLIVATIMRATERVITQVEWHFGTPAFLMRHFGLLGLLIPVAWTLWASWDLEENESPKLEMKWHIAIGLLILILMVWMLPRMLGSAGLGHVLGWALE